MVSNVLILILMMYAYHLITPTLHSQGRLSKVSPGKAMMLNLLILTKITYVTLLE